MCKHDNGYALPLESADAINTHTHHIRALANLIELADKGLSTNELDQGTLNRIGEDIRQRADAIAQAMRRGGSHE